MMRSVLSASPRSIRRHSCSIRLVILTTPNGSSSHKQTLTKTRASKKQNSTSLGTPPQKKRKNDIFFDETEDASLLPPAQPETPYPRMPLVSSLPGTTASPIRIPFGNNKGELIDLPGIYRSSFETSILPQHRKTLIMESRVVPEQYVVKPGQSLLLGGGVLRGLEVGD